LKLLELQNEGTMAKSKDKSKKKRKVVRDKHLLYSASVQSVDADVDFFQRIYKKAHGERFTRFREDFCGTAALACEFIQRSEKNQAWGVDLDQPTLDWGARNYLPKLGDGQERLELICSDVLADGNPTAQVIAALNFSFCVFKTRDVLQAYFRKVRESLEPGGIFFLDIFGGTEALCQDQEKRRIDAEVAFDGTRVPRFTYIWEQARFNPVDHHILCKIHFKLSDGTKLRNAFVYDWRLWTLPELQELLLEAGFDTADVYVEGWDEEADDTDGIFRRRKRFENQDGWVAYVVGRS